MSILDDKVGEAEIELTASKCSNCFFAEFKDLNELGFCKNKLSTAVGSGALHHLTTRAHDSCPDFRHRAYKYCDTCKFFSRSGVYGNNAWAGQCCHKSHTGILESEDTLKLVYDPILNPGEKIDCPHYKSRLII